MRQHLYDLLSGDSQLSTLTGGRIRPVRLADHSTYPALTYQVISAESVSNLEALSTLREMRVQFDSWAKAYADVVSINNRVRALLDGYRGAAGDGEILGAWTGIETDLWEEAVNCYRITSDYQITYRA